MSTSDEIDTVNALRISSTRLSEINPHPPAMITNNGEDERPLLDDCQYRCTVDFDSPCLSTTFATQQATTESSSVADSGGQVSGHPF